MTHGNRQVIGVTHLCLITQVIAQVTKEVTVRSDLPIVITQVTGVTYLLEMTQLIRQVAGMSHLY